MEQGCKSVGIIGAGASGSVCAYFLLKSGMENVTLFDCSSPLRTLLPTGGGRCNFAHAECNFKELASNYPRGGKFLYSVFSRFSTSDTIELFEEFGIKSYTQEDGRIFPASNDSKDVRNKILDKIKKAEFVKEKVLLVKPLENGFSVKTEKSEYYFTDVVIAVGGGKTIEGINHNVIPFKPSLVGLNCDCVNLSGVVLKNVYSRDICDYGDVLFTHFGISGPLIFKISSIKARDNFPYELKFNLYPDGFDFQDMLNSNPHKCLKNILSQIFPQRFADRISGDWANVEGSKIDGKTRDFILDKIENFTVKITGTNKGEETVTAGGYDLKEINSKTMESKVHPHLYIIGEALDVDGFCGGFNLQNAWSTAYVAAEGIVNR